ncbi:hypothetical protein DH2020_015124 [Rehmannia glutinosa]|uniref:Uncharacterized protein n=1 Tax=Rehmannia glutinosa TaxID=99300 RepID=A0ABR0X1L2_REHGL
MEGGKKSGSSFATDLFGAKDNSSVSAPSSAILGSIFATPARVSVGESLNFSETEKKKKDALTQASNAKASVSGSLSDNNAQCKQGQSWSTASNDKSLYYQEEKVEPFHYSSSIYYGGQDVYSPPQSAQNSGKDVEKMTQAVLREEIGGRNLFTTKTLLRYIYLSRKIYI